MLQCKHHDGQSENQSLSWSSESNANHVPAWQTVDKQDQFIYMLHVLYFIIEIVSFQCLFF